MYRTSKTEIPLSFIKQQFTQIPSLSVQAKNPHQTLTVSKVPLLINLLLGMTEMILMVVMVSMAVVLSVEQLAMVVNAGILHRFKE